MLLIYNTTTEAYLTLPDYLEQLRAGSDDVYRILFTYKLGDIFTLAKERTAIRGRYAKDDQGQPMIDRFAITDDEQSLFDSWIKNAGAEVSLELSAWAKDIENAFGFAEGGNLAFIGDNSTDLYVFFYATPDSLLDLDQLPAIETAINESLVTFIIKEWYKLNRLMDDYSIEDGSYIKELGKIKSLMSIPKTPIKRPADWFAL